MSRRRTDPALSWLPDRVYVQRGRYVYQPATGGKVTLCKVDAGKLEVLKRYEQTVETHAGKLLFKCVVTDFFASDTFKELSHRTQIDYTRYQPTITRAFGKMLPNAIEPRHVRMFCDLLAKKRGSKGKPANATANRHKACMQKICSWALQVGRIKVNPCVGVTKLKEVSRDRYITDQEYSAIYNAAEPACRVAMEISYLCMARIGDVVKLSMADVLKDGLYIAQGKTGKKQIKLWSERLTQAVNDCRSLPRKSNVTTLFLISKADGSKYTVRAIQAQYKRACDKAGVTAATFHDLKAKGVSDFDGTLAEKQDAAGHTTASQTAKYDRKIKTVRSVK